MLTDPFIPINKTTLPNGLRVVHHFMPASALVTLNVLYGVGARNESPDLTGIAHLFEHLMFGGSENVDSFDKLLNDAGGVSNAWTGNDFTNFYEVAPAHNAEMLFYLESDRMLRPLVSQNVLDVQRSVVIEEFKQQCLNVPYGDAMHHLRGMVYGEHPYSWPVIGKDFSGLEKVTRQQMLDWWKAHYSPCNAVLAVTGNIDRDTTFALAQKWFASVPSHPGNPSHFPEIRDMVSTKTKTVFGAVPNTVIIIAFLLDKYSLESYSVTDAITDVLSAGKASRFYQQITMNPEAPITEAEAVITGSEDRGMLMLSARLTAETTDPEVAGDYLLEAARSIIRQPVTEHELQRLKNRKKSAFLLANSACMTVAQTIAEAEMHNERPSDKILFFDTLTPGQITAEAKRIFDGSEPAILYYRPSQGL